VGVFARVVLVKIEGKEERIAISNIHFQAVSLTATDERRLPSLSGTAKSTYISLLPDSHDS